MFLSTTLSQMRLEIHAMTGASLLLWYGCSIAPRGESVKVSVHKLCKLGDETGSVIRSWAMCLNSLKYVCAKYPFQVPGRNGYSVYMSKTLEQSAASSAAGSRFIIYAGVWFAVFNWGASFV